MQAGASTDLGLAEEDHRNPSSKLCALELAVPATGHLGPLLGINHACHGYSWSLDCEQQGDFRLSFSLSPHHAWRPVRAGPPPLSARALWHSKANACVRTIAEGFVPGAAAAAEPRACQAIDGSPGARADLHRAGHGKRPIGLRRDAQRSSSHGQRLACPRCGFAARHEAGRLVAVIAKRLVFGSPAPAQRRAGDAAMTEEFDIGMYRIGSVFADTHHIDRRRRLCWAAIAPHIGYGAGGALLGDGDETLCIDGIRMDPRSGRVRFEHGRGLEDTEAGGEAPPGAATG